MGYYINPKNETKESWLVKHGTRITGGSAHKLEEHGTLVPVCLVDNGIFTAAAIAYSKAECEAFSDPSDERPKKWWAVPRKAILSVCPEVAREWQTTEED